MSDPSLGLIDIDQMLTRLRGDETRVRRTLDLFLRDFAACPDEARAALAAGERESLSAIAHRIRGTAGYLGAAKLKESGDRLELLARGDSGADLSEEAEDFIALIAAALEECRQLRLSRFAN